MTQTEGEAVEPGRPGRRLDSTRDAAIRAAALQLVCEVGYERVTMDAIAARCHASKATMYRRWDSKATLIADAMRERAVTATMLPDCGDLRSDLLTGLQAMVERICSTDLELYGGLLTASKTDAQLAKLLREQMVQDKRRASHIYTARAVGRGEISADTDPNLIYEVAPAVVLTRLIITGEPVDGAFLAHVVDDILLPLLKSSTERAIREPADHGVADV